MRNTSRFIQRLCVVLLPWLSVAAPAQDWQELSIADIMRGYQSGEISSEALTRYYLQRIQTLDQQTGVNAMVTLNPDALADAIAADQQRAAGNGTGALHGVPLLIKDNIDVKGLPTTGGSQALNTDALQGARIGVMRYYTQEVSIDPAVLALFEQALEDLRAQGAVLVENFAIAGFEELIQNNWCDTFQDDVNLYLSQQTHAFASTSIAQVEASGLFLPSLGSDLKDSIDNGRSNTQCPDLFEHERNIHFRETVLSAMQDSGVDALVYPTWSHPARLIGDNNGPTGDNSQHIAPHTGLPAITVPMGYNADGLPSGLSLLGPLYSEAQLIGFAYSYEQATKHRRAPDLSIRKWE
jgi:Asp-tRNA(Asn)/Glu-tRNA(Gln) amidotransferase A subunit family amidase